MKSLHLWTLVCGLWIIFTILGCQTTSAEKIESAPVLQTPPPSYESGELIVQLKSDILQFPGETTGEVPVEMITFKEESFRSLCERAQVVSVQYVYTGNRETLPENMRRTYLFHFQQGIEVKEWLRHFEQHPQVQYAEPNYRAYIQQ